MECIEINYKHLFTDSAYKRDAVEAFKENMVSAETLKDYNEHTRVFLLALRRFMGVNFSHNTVVRLNFNAVQQMLFHELNLLCIF